MAERIRWLGVFSLWEEGGGEEEFTSCARTPVEGMAQMMGGGSPAERLCRALQARRGGIQQAAWSAPWKVGRQGDLGGMNRTWSLRCLIYPFPQSPADSGYRTKVHPHLASDRPSHRL